MPPTPRTPRINIKRPFRSGENGSLWLDSISNNSYFGASLDGSLVGVHVFAKRGVDAALIARSGFLEKLEHVGIEAERDLLLVFGGHERAGARPSHSLLRRDIRVVDILILHFLERRFLPWRKPDGLFRVKAVFNDPSMLVSHGYSLFLRK